MEEKEMRTCYACGQVHEKDQICPEILKTLRPYWNTKKSTCFWGNVFMQCIIHKKNFLQLLCEICELTEVMMGNPFYIKTNKIEMNFLELPNNIEMILDYCAAYLHCTVRSLIVSKEEELETFFYNYFKDKIFLGSEEDIENIDYEKRTYSLSINFFIEDFFADSLGHIRKMKKYGDINTLQGYVEKEVGNNKVIYNLYIILPITFGSFNHRFSFMNLDNSSWTHLLLCSDVDGKLKDLYEENSTFDYDELLEDLPCTDPKFTYWKKRILTACNNNLVRWAREKLVRDGYAYKTFYKECDICFCVLNYNSSYSLTVTQNGMGYKFKCENTEEETRYRAMAKIHEAVHQSWKNLSTLHANKKMLSNTKTKHISHKDVIITSNTLACKSHSVVPYRGIVHILTLDNKEETYELYVSFCEDCRTYRAFSSDYEELLRHGKPLCKVFKSEKEYNQNKNNLYTYKSHSVLNTMGYTVKANSGLSTAERRNILLKAISNKLLATDEIISFLNWLIASRKGRSGYETAVDKWTSDMLFLKNYKSKNRKSIKVDSIRV